MVIAAFVLILGIGGAATGAVRDPGESIAWLLLVTGWLGMAGLFAMVPYLVIVDLLIRRLPSPRRWAIVLGGAVPSTGLVLSQLRHPVHIGPQSILVVLTVALVSAFYGAIVRLPGPAPRVTLAEAD